MGGCCTRGEGNAASGAFLTQPSACSPPPCWLRGSEAWSGLAFVPPPEGPEEVFGSPALRAVARGRAAGTPFALMVDVPVSESLIQQFRESTKIRVHPYFLGAKGTEVRVEKGGVRIDLPEAGGPRASA